jgi:hypothetical protein
MFRTVGDKKRFAIVNQPNIIERVAAQQKIVSEFLFENVCVCHLVLFLDFFESKPCGSFVIQGKQFFNYFYRAVPGFAGFLYGIFVVPRNTGYVCRIMAIVK